MNEDNESIGDLGETHNEVDYATSQQAANNNSDDTAFGVLRVLYSGFWSLLLAGRQA